MSPAWMSYRVVFKMFFAPDSIEKFGLTKKEAEKLCVKLNKDNQDMYAWFEVEKE